MELHRHIKNKNTKDSIENTDFQHGPRILTDKKRKMKKRTIKIEQFSPEIQKYISTIKVTMTENDSTNNKDS